MKAFDLILCLAVIYLYYKTRGSTATPIQAAPVPIPMESAPVSIQA